MYSPQCYEGVEANLIQFQAFLTYSLERSSKFASSIGLLTGQKRSFVSRSRFGPFGAKFLPRRESTLDPPVVGSVPESLQCVS